MEPILIHVNTITQNKQTTDEDHIYDFVELLEAGKKLLPITVRKEGEMYILVDGRHRLAACKYLHMKHIWAIVTM